MDGAFTVLKQFLDSSLEHVSNKSAFLCGVMKTYRQKMKVPSNPSSSTTKGPDEEKIKVYIFFFFLKITNYIAWSKLRIYNKALKK